MNILLNTKTGFTRVPAGEQILKVEKVNVVPSGAPKIIEITFKHENGGLVTAKYTIGNEQSMTIFSILVRTILGNVDSFDTSEANKLLGHFIKGTIVHKEVTKDDKVVTYVNLTRILGNADAEPFGQDIIDDLDDTLASESTMDDDLE